jgi:DNA-binding XRE family transcriptional regulator
MQMQQKKDKARQLYQSGHFTQKEIAEMVDVSEKTISKWANAPDDNWEDMKTSLLTTKANELRRLYRFLKSINDKVDEDIASGRKADNKDADIIIKYSAAIKNLETETSIAEKVEVIMELLNMITKEDPEFSKTLAKWCDIFITQSIK